jgi:hypothetical protein|tara:strand:- start:3368 stop:3565 length:198 start_codon:yes stop_codon:yes gene_type:complete
MTKEIRLPNVARMPNDDWRKRASEATRECMHLAIRASDFVIPSSFGTSSFVIVRWAQRLNVALSN